MKFRFKLGDFFLGLATGLAIIVSIVLWIFIMTNDQHFSHLNQQPAATTETNLHPRNKSLYDFYIPTNSYGFKNGRPYRLYDAKKNLPFEFSKNLQTGKITKVKRISGGQANYQALLNNPHFIQLTYPDQITFNLFIRSLHKKYPNLSFNRIFVTSSNHWLYLGNDRKDQLFRLSLEGINFNRLRRYAQHADYQTAVRFVRLKSGYSAFYMRSNKWRIYSYLTEHQTIPYFVGRLLGTSGVSSRTGKNGRTTYSLNYNVRLRGPAPGKRNQHDYLYLRYGRNSRNSKTKRLLSSVYYVHQIGLMEQNLRFFDAEGGNVIYTNYIEGVPVFLNDHDLQVQTSFAPELVKVAFNSLNFQIPVPFDGRTESLPSTSQIINNLEKHGLNEANIEQIIIAFKTEKDKSHHSLVNLVPTYYVKAYGQWKSAADWAKQNMSAYQKIDDNTNQRRGD